MTQINCRKLNFKMNAFIRTNWDLLSGKSLIIENCDIMVVIGCEKSYFSNCKNLDNMN